MSRKAFTVEEAEALLPGLETLLDRMREEVAAIDGRREQLQVLELISGEYLRDPANPDHAEFVQHQEAIRIAAVRLETLIADEVHGRGIRFPAGGLDHGLLDFPTTWQGRWIYLCWRSGETRITAWHEVDAGFAGRQPLTADQARRVGREDDPALVDDSMLDF
jgi:hypothetical protein